jgi:hypothetical protein
VSFEPEVAVDPEDVSESEHDLTAREVADTSTVEAEGKRDELVKPAVKPFDAGRALPANVRAFRSPAHTESVNEPEPEPIEVDDVLIAETVDLAVIEVPEEVAAPADVIAEEAPDIKAEAEDKSDTEALAEDEAVGPVLPEERQPSEEAEPEAKPAGNNAAPSGFESSLLADVDGSLVDESGGYRSPLLSDLGPDKLKGVGLAKWRPEARLTDEEREDEPPRAKRGRGR